MDIDTLLKGVNCECGKFHKCDIEKVYVGKNSIEELKKATSNYGSLLIVADQNTYNATKEKLEKAFENKKTKKVVFSGDKVLIPNEDAIEEVKKHIDGVDLLVGVGSGVIQDLCKYVSFFNKTPYIVYATAPSMDGYASDGAAMILGGMKVTVKAGLPRAIIADSEVIKNAPMEMIKAGYGDIIGKYSALNDWKLSKLINGEYFCSFVYDTTYQMILNVLNTAEGLLKREENSVNALMEALVVVGIMMSFAGSSRPASGSEHHLSHFFEIVGIIDNKPYFPHGIDVAYSTVITSEIREKLAKKPFRKERFTLSKEDYQKEMQRVYKSVAKACEDLQEKVGNYKNDKTKIYLEKEKEIKEILTECPSSIEIKKMLEKVKMDISEFYSLYGEEKIKDAIKYAKDLKDRYTVLWLNYDLGEN